VLTNRFVTPAQAGVQDAVLTDIENHQKLDPGFHREPWIPAFAGMTERVTFSGALSSILQFAIQEKLSFYRSGGKAGDVIFNKE